MACNSSMNHLAIGYGYLLCLFLLMAVKGSGGLGGGLGGGEMILSFPIKHRVREGIKVEKTRRRSQAGGFSSSSITARFSGGFSGSGSFSGGFSSEMMGEFFVVMQIGEPPMEVALTMDTGSELVWLQCVGCSPCEGQILDPIFNPAASSTFSKVSCRSSSWCQGAASVALKCSNSSTQEEEDKQQQQQQCLYSVEYQDKSGSSGYLCEDTLTLSSGITGSPIRLPQFVFGCADSIIGDATNNASGVIGLNRGRHSAPSQLQVQHFSYCLPDRSINNNVAGYLTFHSQSFAKQQLQYTPLINLEEDSSINISSKGFYEQFYYVNITGISIGGHLLNISQSSFEIDPSTGFGGTIIDSGTALTSFVDEAYVTFRDMFKSHVIQGVLVEAPESGLDTCYYVSPQLQIPIVTIHFEHALDLTLPLTNIFTTISPGIICLAFTSSGGTRDDGYMNILGNFQQQGIHMEFDLVNSQVGLAVTQCSSSNAPNLHILLNWIISIVLVNLLAL